MKSTCPIVASTIFGDSLKSVHLQWVAEDDAFEESGFIICLSQLDKESVPGSTLLLDEKDIYLSLHDLKRFCLHGLRVHNEVKKMITARQMEQFSEFDDLLLAFDDEDDD